jgi:hypothetical protein
VIHTRFNNHFAAEMQPDDPRRLSLEVSDQSHALVNITITDDGIVIDVFPLNKSSDTAKASTWVDWHTLDEDSDEDDPPDCSVP